MRNSLATLTLVLGGVLFGTASCGEDEATGGGGTAKAGYCEPCYAASDCESGNTCRSVSGSLGVCAKASDTKCCVPGTTNCQDNLGDPIGSGGKGGSGSGGGGGSG